MCNFIHHSHLSPLSLLDTLGHTLCFQVLRFFLGNWGSPGICPWNFSLLTIMLQGSHRAPQCFAENSPSSLSGIAVKSKLDGPLLPSAQSRRALVSDPRKCNVPFLGPFSHNLDMFKVRTWTGTEANNPSLPAAAFQAHRDGKSFRQKAKQGQTHNVNHISSGLLLLILCCPFSSGLIAFSAVNYC